MEKTGAGQRPTALARHYLSLIMSGDARRHVEEAVRAASGGQRVLLAVSGGLDSMVLLHSAMTAIPERVVAVATFDHRSGAHATDAVALVMRSCEQVGVRCLTGRATGPRTTEAGWRTERWRFLQACAASEAARVTTAHHRDDHAETVFMRALRDAGARGLAGLDVDGVVLRPFLALSRAVLASYAATHRLAWVEDPTNASMRHLRNRTRHELLPACVRAHPGFRDELLAVARDAAAWRRDVERVAARVAIRAGENGVHVAMPPLHGYDATELAVLWPAVAARAGIVLDRRGTRRLAEFTTAGRASGRTGARVQLSGGVEVVRRRDGVLLRRTSATINREPVQLHDGTRFAQWRFRRAEADGANGVTDAWCAELPEEGELTIRSWRAGDRMQTQGDRPTRRVARFFGDAGIPGPERVGWPVVLVGDEVVWIPGVRRSEAASDRSGRPTQRYVCERNHG